MYLKLFLSKEMRKSNFRIKNNDNVFSVLIERFIFFLMKIINSIFFFIKWRLDNKINIQNNF